MDKQLRDALPKCRFCGQPCHPTTAVSTGSRVEVIPDVMPNKPPTTALSGIFCSHLCLLSMWKDIGDEIERSRGLGGEEHEEEYEEDDDD